MIEILNVSHRYGKARPVLKSVSMSIATGEAVALLGPSGSGKTTLLMIAGGLLHPTEGRISRASLAMSPGTLTDQAWIFQTANLLRRRSSIENAALGLLAAGWALDDAIPAARRALEAMGIEHKADARPIDLSGGEAQRVSIARAIAAKPRFILADEPTGQLDRRTTSAITRRLLAGRYKNTSALVATHDPLVADECDRQFSIDGGRLVAS